MDISTLEQPRPDFARRSWLTLNGQWRFAFDDNDVGIRQRWYMKMDPDHFNLRIVVPFCYQSRLSTITEREDHQIVWYAREFEINDREATERALLNFGAADYETDVWINGIHVGNHKGGNCSFLFEISPYLIDGSNLLVVRCVDRNELFQPRGKQYWAAGTSRCWYTKTTGIWQSVWLEFVGSRSFQSIFIKPNIDNNTIDVEIELDGAPNQSNLSIEMDILFDGVKEKTIAETVRKNIFTVTVNLDFQDGVDNVHLWSPENPKLYQMEIRLLSHGTVQDEISSYFGMRKISVMNGSIMLNNRPYYPKLVLDQGYWPDSMQTAPSDQAIIDDIVLAKSLGFNGARKHQKVEDPRYYYWADKLGFLVWAELPSAYDFSTQEATNLFLEFIDFIRRDRNHPSIIVWVPLNESWGVRNIAFDKHQQDFSVSMYYLAKCMDGTRLVSTNDGWEQTDTDLCCIHCYAKDGAHIAKLFSTKERLLDQMPAGRPVFAEGYAFADQPILLTEFGGIALRSQEESGWGYNEPAADSDVLTERLRDLFREVYALEYLGGFCYTQLYDVEAETNGLLDANRHPKAAVEVLRRIIQGNDV